MKKILLVALAAAAMVGCSQNEEIENAGQKAEIKIGAVVGVNTKAVIVENDKFTAFKVFAYKTTDKMASAGALTTFMDGVNVTKNPEWSYTGGPYYWPATGYVQFFSVVPETTLTVGSGYPKFDYTVGKIDDQKDLIAANLIDKDKSTGAIQLPFNHLLTQVNFSIAGDKDFTYTLTSLELVGVKDKGTFTFNGSATAGSWSAQVASSPTPTEYKYVGSVELVSTGNNSVKLDTDANALFMLLPQTIAADAVVVKVTYSAKATADPNQITVDNATKEVAIPAGAWAQGKRARYTLQLTSDASQVTFGDPVWSEWDSEETGGEVKPVTPTPVP